MGEEHNIDVQSLWEKYEELAMHFNDLLIRLRTQSLAGVAAIAAIVGIFAKESSDVKGVHLDWAVAQALFLALIGFWIAIWCLDLIYYNRLLSGAVKAITDLEEQTDDGSFDGKIEISRTIEKQFSKPILNFSNRSYWGVVLFYLVVLVVLVAGLCFSHSRI
jgi:hypothetical protein